MICPLCGQTDPHPLWEVGDRLFRTTPQRFHIHQCRGCSLRLLGPVPSPEELTAFYPAGYWIGAPDQTRAKPTLRQGLLEAYRRLVLVDHVRFVRRIAGRQQREGVWRGILDVGCGDGSFLSALGVRPAVGLDRSAAAAAAVHARGFGAVVGDLAATPMRDGSYSLVTMFHYLEHVPQAAVSLEAVRRLLTPGGRLVVQVPNTASWQALLLGRRWHGYEPPRHLVNYTPQALATTLAKSGFEAVRATFFSLRDNPTTLVNSVAPGLFPPARAARGESQGAGEWAANLAYLALVWMSVPFTLLESACRRGAAVMVEARPV